MTMFGYACDRCREKHQSCNHELPCKRCTKANLADTCHYTPKRTRTKATRPASSMSMMSSTSGSSNSNSPIRGPMTVPFHAFMQNHPMQSPMHFDPSTGGMAPYGSRSPPPLPLPAHHMMMMPPPLQQQMPQQFVPSQAPQGLFGHNPPFMYAELNGNSGPRFLPPSMPPHGHHFYPGYSHMQPHHPMAGPQYHPYHTPSPPPPPPPPPSSLPLHPQMAMPPNPYTFVPSTRRTSNQSRSTFGKQQGGRRISRSALGEALHQPVSNNLESRASHYPQHIPPSSHLHPASFSPPPPYSELLDGIHYAASQHYHSEHASMPNEEATGYHSMDGSALMASGVLVQEYIRDALAMIHDEGASNPATQHHVLGVGNDGIEEMKHHQHAETLSRTERNGSSSVAQPE